MKKNSKLKLFISQPMHGLDDDDIRHQRKSMHELVCIMLSKDISKPEYDIKLINQFDRKDPKNFTINHPSIRSQRIYRLGRSIRLMADANLCVFYGDWQRSKGCIVERAVCEEYCIPYLDNNDIIKFCKENMDSNIKVESLFEELYPEEYDKLFDTVNEYDIPSYDDEEGGENNESGINV